MGLKHLKFVNYNIGITILHYYIIVDKIQIERFNHINIRKVIQWEKIIHYVDQMLHTIHTNERWISAKLALQKNWNWSSWIN